MLKQWGKQRIKRRWNSGNLREANKDAKAFCYMVMVLELKPVSR